MELTKNERKLIEAVRAMDEVPYNILLWYSAGRQEAQRKLKESTKFDYRYEIEQDQRLIDIANHHMRNWDKK